MSNEQPHRSTIAIVTDSNAQFPARLVKQLGIDVVDIPIVIDGVERGESDIDIDDFYESYARGALITTSQPSPGEFAGVYSRLAERGFDRIISIHVGSNLSGTVNSARLGADLAETQIDVVDTGQSSFALGLCVWSAVDALRGGAGAAAILETTQSTADLVGNVFVLGALDIAKGSGRVEVTGGDVESTSIPVVSLVQSELKVVGQAAGVTSAAEAMISVIAEVQGPIRVGIGVGDIGAIDFYEALHAPVEALDNVAEVIRYRCGPSVGAFSGPGVAGMAWAPLERGEPE